MEEARLRLGLTDCVNQESKGLVEVETRTDEELVELVLAGEVEVFAQLYRRYYGRTYRLAYGMTGHQGVAEDLTQEIFFRAYERLHQYRGEARFATWFHRLAVNQSLSYRRRERDLMHQEITEHLIGTTASAARPPETNLLQRELQAQVQRALLSLKPKLRMVTILKDIEGLSYEEIAERMNCSMGTVASSLNRARKLLARKLEHLKEAY